MTQKTIRKKFTEQTGILLSKDERAILDKLKNHFKGTNSQVLRLALSKLASEILKEDKKNDSTE